MFARLSQLSRHLSRPLPNYAHSFAPFLRARMGSSIMTSSAEEKTKRMIHTAACLIIGDEVLGGKVPSVIRECICPDADCVLEDG